MGFYTKVTPKVFEQVMELLETANNEDSFIRGAMLLPVWEEEYVDKTGREEWLHSLWVADHRSLQEIVTMSKMSKAQFYRYFRIPRRTFQDWIYEKSVAPKYTLFMIQEILGYVTRY